MSSDNVAARIGRSESPSSIYDTGDLSYEREEADALRRYVGEGSFVRQMPLLTAVRTI